MSLFSILQLSIISALGLMVQSAPINTMINKRSTQKICTDKNVTVVLTALENRIYCAAVDLHNANGQLRKAKYNLRPSDLPKIDINTKIEIVNKLYNLSSYRCKQFTTVMILKHRLQDYIFNAGTADLELNSEHVAKNLYIILTSLQTMANSFNDIEISITNKRCVKFAPAQYKIMYYAKYTSLLEILTDYSSGWYQDFCTRLKSGINFKFDESH